MEQWQIDHNRLYGSHATPHQESIPLSHRLGPGPKNPFRVCRVSKDTDDLIRAVERAVIEVASASIDDREAMSTAYSHLCVCRESLYNHISRMEQQTRVVRDVVKRF